MMDFELEDNQIRERNLLRLKFNNPEKISNQITEGQKKEAQEYLRALVKNYLALEDLTSSKEITRKQYRIHYLKAKYNASKFDSHASMPPFLLTDKLFRWPPSLSELSIIHEIQEDKVNRQKETAQSRVQNTITHAKQ